LDAILATIDTIDDVLKSDERYLKAMYTLWFESIGHKSSFHDHTVRRNNNARLAVVRLVEEGKKNGQISSSANAPNFAVSFISLVTGLIYQMLASPQNIDTHKALKDLKAFTMQALTWGLS